MKKMLVVLFMSLSSALIIFSITHAGYTVTQLGDKSYNDEGPKISNSGHVVWDSAPDGSDPEMYLYDGSNIIRLTDDDNWDYEYDISANGIVVWVSDGAIFLYTDTKIPLYDRPGYDQGKPDINKNGVVVWNGRVPGGSDYEILLYNGSSIVQLTDNSFDDRNPKINAIGHVVWEGSPDGFDTQEEVYLYNGSEIIRLTDNTSNDLYPLISKNGHVTWKREIIEGPSSYRMQVMLYNGSEIIQLSDNSQEEYAINAYGNVVWSSKGKIFLYDGSVTTQLNDSYYNSSGPDINDNGYIVYSSWRSFSDRGIVLYDGSTATMFDNSSAIGPQFPKINAKGDIVWQQNIGGMYNNIFLAVNDDPYNTYDTNHDCIIGDFELLDAIDNWAIGNLGDFELLDLIDFWAAGSYC